MNLVLALSLSALAIGPTKKKKGGKMTEQVNIGFVWLQRRGRAVSRDRVGLNSPFVDLHNLDETKV